MARVYGLCGRYALCFGWDGSMARREALNHPLQIGTGFPVVPESNDYSWTPEIRNKRSYGPVYNISLSSASKWRKVTNRSRSLGTLPVSSASTDTTKLAMICPVISMGSFDGEDLK
jgi:hypothetical protein